MEGRKRIQDKVWEGMEGVFRGGDGGERKEGKRGQGQEECHEGSREEKQMLKEISEGGRRKEKPREETKVMEQRTNERRRKIQREEEVEREGGKSTR